MAWKRHLHLVHRWLGITLCLLFCAWFLSGFIMMYVPFPSLTPPERRAAAPALAWPTTALAPGPALAGLQAGDFTTRGTPARQETIPVANALAPVAPDTVRLARIQDRPAYVATLGGAQPVVLFADDGSRLRAVTPAAAIAAAAAFAPDSTPRYDRLVQSDQWAVSAALNAHRPLHRVALGDARGTVLYVSGTTGEVVRDTHRRERALNWLGAVVHWIYPHFLRQHPEAWRWTVNLLAAPGTALALSGLLVGGLRFRRRRLQAPRGARQRLIHWHYVAGVLFGGVTFTFIFSGWLSMNPGRLNPPRTPTAAEHLALAGGPLDAAAFLPPPPLPADTVEVELRRHAAQPFYLAITRDGTRHRLPAGPEPLSWTASDADLRRRAAALQPAAAPPLLDTLVAYDNHYYTRTPAHGTRPLPTLRVRFADADATWFHLDPFTGAIIDRSTRVNRLYRHLYNGLHSFDWWWLWSRRPLWDIVMLTVNLGGLALSALGVAAGVRRLRPAPRPSTPAASTP